MIDIIITRANATERGLTRYFTGKPCIHGHIAERRTINQRCTSCIREYQQDNAEKNRGRWPRSEETRRQDNVARKARHMRSTGNNS